MSGDTAVVVWCPFPGRDCAKAIAEELLKERLIACANIINDVESIFEWDGNAGSAKEVVVLFKTAGSCHDQMVSRLGELHPYDTPAIVGWNCSIVHPDTASWLSSVLGQDESG